MSRSKQYPPGHPAEVARRTLVIKLHTLLRAVESGVLVLADDVPIDQAFKIERELGVMRSFVDLQRDVCGVKHAPGSVHFKRQPTEGGGHVH